MENRMGNNLPKPDKGKEHPKKLKEIAKELKIVGCDCSEDNSNICSKHQKILNLIVKGNDSLHKRNKTLVKRIFEVIKINKYLEEQLLNKSYQNSKIRDIEADFSVQLAAMRMIAESATDEEIKKSIDFLWEKFLGIDNKWGTRALEVIDKAEQLVEAIETKESSYCLVVRRKLKEAIEKFYGQESKN